MSKLRKTQQQLNEEGGGIFLRTKDMGEQTIIRLLPPRANMDGVYFRKLIQWWIAKKPYISMVTFGEPDPIAEVIEEASEGLKTHKDPQLHTLLSDEDNLKQAVSYYIPVLLMEALTEDGNKLNVVGPRILQANRTIMTEINKIVTHPEYQTDTEDGITDRVEGVNLYISKSGKGMKTEYAVMAARKATEIAAKWYGDKVPDVHTMVEKMRRSKAYLKSVIDNYLYGDPILEDEKEEDEAPAPRTAARRPSAAEVPAKPARRAPRGGDDEDEAPAPRRSSPGRPAAQRDPVKDLQALQDAGGDGDDDEDEDETPAPRRAEPPARARRTEPEDDDDDDDEKEEEAPAPPARGRRSASAPPSKGGGAKKKPADDDGLNDD